MTQFFCGQLCKTKAPKIQCGWNFGLKVITNPAGNGNEVCLHDDSKIHRLCICSWHKERVEHIQHMKNIICTVWLKGWSANSKRWKYHNFSIKNWWCPKETLILCTPNFLLKIILIHPYLVPCVWWILWGCCRGFWLGELSWNCPFCDKGKFNNTSKDKQYFVSILEKSWKAPNLGQKCTSEHVFSFFMEYAIYSSCPKGFKNAIKIENWQNHFLLWHDPHMWTL